MKTASLEKPGIYLIATNYKNSEEGVDALIQLKKLQHKTSKQNLINHHVVGTTTKQHSNSAKDGSVGGNERGSEVARVGEGLGG